MIAIRIRGISVPPILNAKTSPVLGEGTGVDLRTVIYEIRKQLKIKVSLSRKIHIMTFPQETFLNARWSEDQSATTVCQRGGRVADSAVFASVGSTIWLRSSLAEQRATHCAETVRPVR